MATRPARLTKAMSIDPPKVSPDIYDAAYFLGKADGAAEFGAGAMHGRYSFALAELDVPPGGVLLDIGCGRGELLGLAVEDGVGRAIGVEYAEAAVAIAREHLQRAGVSDRCHVHHADARDLPLAADSVDAVAMMDVIEHLAPDEQQAALTEARRVLRPGGKILLHTFPNRGIYDFYSTLRRIWPGGRRWPVDPRNEYEHAMHVGELTGKEMGELLDGCGYRNVEVSHIDWTYTDHLPSPSARRFYRLLAKFPPTAAKVRASIVARARA